MSVGGLHSVKRLNKSLAKRFLREASERVTHRNPSPVGDLDRELTLLVTPQNFVRQLTKAPRRK